MLGIWLLRRPTLSSRRETPTIRNLLWKKGSCYDALRPYLAALENHTFLPTVLIPNPERPMPGHPRLDKPGTVTNRNKIPRAELQEEFGKWF